MGHNNIIEKRCSVEELYALACNEWDRSMQVDLKGHSMQIGINISLDSSTSEKCSNADEVDENIEEDFMMKFLLSAALVIGIGYGVYKLVHEKKDIRQKKPESVPENTEKPASSVTVRPPAELTTDAYLLLAVEISKLEKLYPGFIEKVAITIDDYKDFYTLPWFLLPTEQKKIINSVKLKVDNVGPESDYALLLMALPVTEINNLRKESPGSEKRKAFEKFEGKTVSVLGTVTLKDLEPFSFYAIG
jgi:hypothetical protein